MRFTNSLTVRPATSQDRPRLANLLSRARWRHFHLDWRDPLDTIEAAPNLIAEADGRLVAYLAAPPDPAGAAWLRSFCVDPGFTPLPAWRRLWAEAASQNVAQGVQQVASLLSGDWMRPLLAEAGFRETNAVVFFEWSRDRLPQPPSAAPSVRSLRTEDLPGVVRVDSRAFGLLWQNGHDSLAAALRQSIVATGIEIDGRLAAYQLTTASPFGAHLARLAVDPEFQRRGLAQALVVDLLRHLERRGYRSITLNTQADNLRSQDLYRKLGFRETGQRYPVFEVQLG